MSAPRTQSGARAAATSARPRRWPVEILLFIARAIRLIVLSMLFVPTIFVLARTAAGPRALRWYLEACGGAMVKFGQILAMRYDLLPPEYCQALATMLDSMRPFPASQARQTIEAELGRSIAECFSELEDVPIGSASMAQVHRARLPGGERVVVKVLRPGIERQMNVDLRLLRWIAALLDELSVGGTIRGRELVLEFERLTREELDLNAEALSADKLHQLLQQDDIDHYAPRVYFELTSRSVMTLELLEGVWMTELLDAVRTHDCERLAAFAARNITPRRTARLLFRSFLEQAYRHRMFHADPHPGNLILLTGGTLAYVDFGIVGWLEERTWRQQYRLFEAISRADVEKAFDVMASTVVRFADSRPQQFEQEFKSQLRSWIATTGRPDSAVSEKSSGRFLLTATLAIRRARMGLTMHTLRLHRAALVSDMVQLSLDPELDVRHEMDLFFRENLGHRIRDRVRQWLDFEGQLLEWLEVNDAARNVVPNFLERTSRSIRGTVAEPSEARRGTTALEESLGLLARRVRNLMLSSNLVVVALWQFGGAAGSGGSRLGNWAAAVAGEMDGAVVLLWAVTTVLAGWTMAPLARRLRPVDS
jgi:ubiquinone biosynthesis protein